MKEQFKKHPLYNYYISNKGRVKGIKTDYLKPTINNGYYIVGIYHKTFKNRQKQKRIHRLVVETFIGEIPEGYCVNHIDGDKLNNHLDNLEIVTFKDNVRHAYENKLARGRKGSENSCSKLLVDEVLNIYKLIKKGKTNKEISEIYNLHERYISLIRHGKRWEFLWKKYFIEAPISNGNTDLPLDFMLNVIKECEGYKTNLELSKKFNLDPSTISRIRNKKTWKSIWQLYELNATTIEPTL